MEDEGPQHLETGWDATTARGDTVVRTAVLAHVDGYAHLARARGGRVQHDPDLALADAGSPSLYFNTAVLLRPVPDTEFEATIGRVEEFFAPRPGGRVLLLSPWPTPGVARNGWELAGHPPLMLRPGGIPAISPPVPPGLRIHEVADDELLSAFEAVLVEGYPLEDVGPPDPGCLFDGRALEGGSFHCWVGTVGGRAVAASAAHFAADMVVVSWVATLAEFRGRGYGAALTWAALREAPRLPAALLASDPGRPVYERMGFLPLVRLTVWTGRRRPVPGALPP